MAKKIVINPNINPDLQNNNFNNVPSSVVNKIGGFEITTNFEDEPVKFFGDEIESISKIFTLDSITNNKYTQSDLDFANQLNQELKLNFDKSDLGSYSSFGSMAELLRVTIENIVSTFPFSIFVNTVTNPESFFSVIDYSFDKKNNSATFKTNILNFENPANINFFTSNNTVSSNNLITNFSDYVIFYDNNEYEILGFTGNTKTDNYVSITVNSNIFPEALTGNKYIDFHIKPKLFIYDKYINSLPDLEKYFLSNKTETSYLITLKNPIPTSLGNYMFEDTVFEWLTIDGYNLDISSTQFQGLINDLLTIGNTYDSFKTDIIYRLLVPDSITQYDATGGDDEESRADKMKKILRIYGREFDEIKRFINSLVFINDVTYNKKRNIPDLLIKNLASTLGWEYFDIVTENDIFKSVFTQKHGQDLTPSQINIELWRRIIINTNFFFKKKGTREALLSIFEMIGVPDTLMELTEHVYLVEGKVSFNQIQLEGLTSTDGIDLTFFVSEDGYPIMLNNVSGVYFQNNGNEDAGQTLINYYRQAGFNLHKTIDNTKIWTDDEFNRFDEINNTNYQISDNKLIINTKEININIDPAKQLESSVYNFNKKYGKPINENIGSPYPQLDSNKFDVSELSFVEYIQLVAERYVDAKNRKILSEYPTLKQLYYDYLKDNDSPKHRYRYILKYANLISTYFNKFIKQLLPATAILTQQGVVIRNPLFDKQKFQYRRGINDGSEFVSELPPSVDIEIPTFTIEAEKNDIVSGNLNSYQLIGGYESSLTDDFSFQGTINKKVGFDCDFYEYQEPVIIDTNICKIDNNVEEECIYLYDVILSGKTVDISVSGQTGDLLIWDMFLYDKSISGFTDTKYFTVEIPLSASTLNYNFLIPQSNLLVDKEYLLKPYVKTSILTGENLIPLNNISDMYGNFDDIIYPNVYEDSYIFFQTNIGERIININTEDISVNLPYRKYRSDKDFYFVSLGSPQEPFLTLESQTPPSNQFLRVEQLDITFSAQTQAYLSSEPFGDVELSFDGSVLTKNIDYSGTTNPTVFDLLFTIDDNEPHYLQASYLAGSGSLLIFKEITHIDSIVSGVLNDNSSKMFYNTATSNYEYTTDFEITSLSNFKLIFNASVLTNGVDFNISSINNRTIILYFTVNIGDVFMIFYETSALTNEIITVNTNPFAITFDSIIATTDSMTGYFKIQISDYPDINFVGSIQEFIVDYIIGERIYSYTPSVALTPSGGLKVIRVANIKEYQTIGGDIIESTVYSDYKLVRLPI